MADIFGPSFSDEVFAAGLNGLPFSWGADGQISGRERLTPEQNATLDAVIAAHNPASQSAAVVRSNEFIADAVRAELLAQLRDKTPAQIETFVRTRINANAATNLATVIACLKRMETGFVQFAKVLARSIRDNGL